MVVNLKTLNPYHPGTICAKFGWNWFRGRFLKILSMYYHYFVIISSWKRVWPFIWIYFYSLHPMVLCVKFGWNWPSGSEEDLNFVNHYAFSLFYNSIFPWKRALPFIWWNLNSFHQRMVCAFSPGELKIVGSIMSFNGTNVARNCRSLHKGV